MAVESGYIMSENSMRKVFMMSTDGTVKEIPMWAVPERKSAGWRVFNSSTAKAGDYFPEYDQSNTSWQEENLTNDITKKIDSDNILELQPL